jgi:hypothetical protein
MRIDDLKEMAESNEIRRVNMKTEHLILAQANAKT